MSRRLFVFALAALAAFPVVLLLIAYRPAAAVPDAGIPLSLAQGRASRVSDLAYEVSLTVPAQPAQPIQGRMRISFALSSARRPLAFDFAQPTETLHSVAANGTVVVAQIENGHIVIPADALVDGINHVEMTFIAGDESLNRRDDFLYALFVPARASLALPVFDQPDLKARWQLNLVVPQGWEAVSNENWTGRQRMSDGTELFVFGETKPISTYLFSFAAGKFSVEQAERGGRTFRMFHRETDAAKVARNRDAVFDLHARALAWLEDYTGIPYPFGKFDFVLIPSFQFGGMEHPGAVFYNASGLLLEESATQNQVLGRASVIAHETAHMWFGDLVTMRWFNDVWMKEVFANFMAAKIVNPSFPDVNHALRFLYAHYPAAYEIDRTAGANPVHQELQNLNEAGSLYGAIIYQKAPIAMRQLELLIGADAMRDGLREYLRNDAYGNATWPDLVELLDARAPQDLRAWSRAWIEAPGRPTIHFRSHSSDAVSIEVVDPRGRGLEWFQARLIKPARLDGNAIVLPNGDGVGYGDFVLDPPTLEYLTTSLHRIEDPLPRGAALVTLWESMLEGRVAPARVIDALLVALPVETDELTVSQMLEYLRDGFWRFTRASDRPALAARVERVLRDGLARAASTSMRASWFNTIRSVATLAPTVGWLEQLWRREIRIEGLPFSEPDEAELALDLAVRDVPNAEAILAAQTARFTNPDRKARFVFVAPAVSRDANVRRQFFESLRDVQNRAHEAWVLEGLRYLHHPWRAETSNALVVPGLGLVLEIQRTGDIFFPKRWADAMLGGSQTPAMASAVRAFIDGLPAGYPPRLKWVLLASADPLFRAADALQ